MLTPRKLLALDPSLPTVKLLAVMMRRWFPDESCASPCGRSDFGADVAFINAALGRVFRDYNIDPQHVALAGEHGLRGHRIKV